MLSRIPAAGRLAAFLDKRHDDPDQPTSSLRMRGNETLIAYAASLVLAVIPIVFLTVTTGKGAPAHPRAVVPALGLVLGVAMAASVQLSNRVLSAILAMASSLATTATVAPVSVRYLSTADLFAALGFSVLVLLRQSKARNALLAERRKAKQTSRPSRPNGTEPARRGRKGAKEPEPTGPRPSSRYTPPKKRS